MPSSLLLKKCKTIVTLVGAKFDARKEFKLQINTDSRSFTKGETFVALVGESFDGYNYLGQVLEAGAKAVVFKSTPEREATMQIAALLYPQILFISVTDTLLFIQELAHLHLEAWKKINKENIVIGVTGSNGKTTHKEMIKFLLESIKPNKVLATSGNLNNHIGVPLTIFKLQKNHQVAIIEMGMSNPGEIKALCDIAMPMAGMITNVGPAHIEFMKTIENIFKEKASLYDAVLKNQKGRGVFVVNADDLYLSKLKSSKGLVTYGEKSADAKIKIDEQKVSFELNKKEMSFTNNDLLERHNLKNLVGTLIFSMKLFPKSEKKLLAAAASYKQPSMNRSQWNGHIFLDAYNANPSSMKISVDSFVSIMKNKKVDLNDCFFVLGDMNELGEHAQKMHKEIAQHLEELGVKHVAFIGRYKDFYLEGFKGESKSYLTKEEFHEDWKSIRVKFKFIFIKASRSLKLETLMNIV